VAAVVAVEMVVALRDDQTPQTSPRSRPARQAHCAGEVEDVKPERAKNASAVALEGRVEGRNDTRRQLTVSERRDAAKKAVQAL
jgi:hypothetical protein